MILNTFLTLCFVVITCHGYSSFKQFIPNVNIVPNPCTEDENDVCDRLGHVIQDWKKDKKTKQKKTKFGLAFLAIKRTGVDLANIWEALCSLDSDGDGRLNGEELGDKDCKWRINNRIPLPTAGLTHPGIPDDEHGSITKSIKKQFCK